MKVKGTIFNELDDEKLHSLIDFNEFEEQFKMGTNMPMPNSSDEIEGLVSQGSKRIKRPELLTLLEHNRLRNIGKYFSDFFDLMKFNHCSNDGLSMHVIYTFP